MKLDFQFDGVKYDFDFNPRWFIRGYETVHLQSFDAETNLQRLSILFPIVDGKIVWDEMDKDIPQLVKGWCDRIVKLRAFA